jgi:hypothetical protein
VLPVTAKRPSPAQQEPLRTPRAAKVVAREVVPTYLPDVAHGLMSDLVCMWNVVLPQTWALGASGISPNDLALCNDGVSPLCLFVGISAWVVIRLWPCTVYDCAPGGGAPRGRAPMPI